MGKDVIHFDFSVVFHPSVFEALEPSRVPTVVEFAEDEYVLGEGHSLQGPWQWDNSPYLLEIALCFTIPRLIFITMMSATQTGKSMLGMLWLAWIICCNPKNFLDVLPRQDDIERRIVEDIRPMLTEIPCVLKHLIGDPYGDVSKKGAKFDRMNYHTAFATNPMTLASLRVPYIRLDECKEFGDTSGKQGNTFKLAYNRTRTFSEKKIMAVSSPVEENQNIHAQFQKGDQSEYWVPCPHCGEYFPVRWDIVHFAKAPEKSKDGKHHKLPAEDYLDPENSWYACDDCGSVFLDPELWMSEQRGVWRPADMDDETFAARVKVWEVYWAAPGLESPEARAEALDTLVESLMENWQSRHRSFVIPSLLSHPSFADDGLTKLTTLVNLFAEAHEEQKRGNHGEMQTFYNNELARPFRQKTLKIDDIHFDRHTAMEQVQFLPDGVQTIAAGIDVQSDRFYCVVVGFNEDWEAWLLDHRVVMSGYIDEKTNEWKVCGTNQQLGYQSLSEFLSQTWAIDRTRGMKISRVALDSADGSVTNTVRDVCAAAELFDFIMPAKGDANINTAYKFVDINAPDKQKKRKKEDQNKVWPGVKCLNFSPRRAKDRIFAAYINEVPGAAYLHFPWNVSKEYRDHFHAQERNAVKTGSRTVYKWVGRYEGIPDHFFDATAIAYGVGSCLFVGQRPGEDLLKRIVKFETELPKDFHEHQ